MLMRQPVIGEILSLVPIINIDKNGCQGEEMTGEVVYINREHRFYTAEFTFPNGWRFRESFKFAHKSDIAIKPYQKTGAQFWDERRYKECPILY